MNKRTAAIALALGAALACDDAVPTSPTTVAVSLLYQPSREPGFCSAPTPEQRLCFGGCAHHGAPANLTATTSWGETVRLDPCGVAHCAVLFQVPVRREVTVSVHDIAQCCRDCTTLVRRTVYVNGTALSRSREDPVTGQPGGLIFTVDPDGLITP
jgi:hypothetical protein